MGVVPLSFPEIETLKQAYRQRLLAAPMNEFLQRREGTPEEFICFGLRKAERMEVWQAVYEQRTLLRPACEPGRTLLRASQEVSTHPDELLRGSNK